MVALDSGTGAGAARFNDVRVDSALNEVIDMTDFLGFFFKDANEFFADNLAFLFRIADALEFRQETFLGVNTDEVHVKVSFEDLFHLVAFVLTKQAMVNKDAGELLTHGLVDENRSNRGINAAAHGAQDILIPTFSRMASIWVWAKLDMDQSPERPQISKRKLLNIFLPKGVCMTSG